MKTTLSDHPSNFLELEQAKQMSSFLTSIGGDFMNSFNLSHIWVSRYFFDGRYIDLTNDIKWKDIMVKNNFYRDYIQLFLEPLSNKSVSKNNLCISWQAIKASSDKLIAKTNEYGIISGFNLLFIHEDHIENYGFGSPLEINKILFDQAEVELFSLYLREKIDHLIASNPLALGFSGEEFTRPSLKNKYFHSPIPQSFTFTCNSMTAKVTQREVQCLALMAQGLSQKEIARILGVSPRTIEFHFTQIKIKFNYPSKLELLLRFKASPLSRIDPFLLINSTY